VKKSFSPYARRRRVRRGRVVDVEEARRVGAVAAAQKLARERRGGVVREQRQRAEQTHEAEREREQNDRLHLKTGVRKGKKEKKTTFFVFDKRVASVVCVCMFECVPESTKATDERRKNSQTLLFLFGLPFLSVVRQRL